MSREWRTLLFQGDSITDCGRGVKNVEPNEQLGGGYAGLIATELLLNHPGEGLRIFNRGISGNRVVDLYARWKIDALNLKPDMISVLIGVNDTWHEFGAKNGVEPPRYEKVYRELLTWTREVLPSVRLVLCEPFVLQIGAVTEAWLPEIRARQEIVRRLAGQFEAVFVPFQKVFDDATRRVPANYWLIDGVHPTVPGHALMAKAWLKSVENV